MTSLRRYAFAQLASADVARMRALMAMFAEAFEDADSYAHRPPSDAYLAGLLAKSHFIALVAFDGDAVVGGLTAYQLDKPEQERSEIYIYDLAVTALQRRRGIATGLIERLREIATDRGAWVVFVQADMEDAPAIALYHKLGVKETAHHFDIAVPRRS